jgi:multidrug efflux pump subunit AcrB
LEVVVKFNEASRQSSQDIEQLKIPTKNGGLIPFENVARFTIQRGWSTIKRFDGERAVTIGADIDSRVTSPVEVSRQLKEHFLDVGASYPGYRLDFRGEFKEFEEAFDNVTRLFLVGVILMYLILASQFRSYLQPFLILFAIPFAFTGSMVALLLLGYKFSINIMFGMVALAGVAVNDSIVLVAFINDARARGASLHRAILTGSKRRLRPIFLTTVTTIFGLMPLAIGVGGVSKVWMPLANTIVWGLGAATFLILVVMPPLYAALDDISRWVRRRPANPVGMPEALSPDSAIRKGV